VKNILLLVHDDPGQEARFQTALDITRALGGHLTCVDVVQMPAPIGADIYSGSAQAMLLADECSREADNATALKARLAKEDVSWDWKDAAGGLAQSVIEASNLADLIVVNRNIDGLSVPDMRGVASVVATRSRIPIVAVSDQMLHFRVNGRVLIAWDGSPSVMATMRACVPLLKLAAAVHLVMIVDGAEQADVEDAATYLSRHGINASMRRINDGLTAPDQLIGQEARVWNADYCLMGAYNHGRLAEAIFGGVTHRMLKSSALPLVLGH